MVIENVNILKNEDDTFMMQVFIDNGYEKVEVIVDRVIFDDFILTQSEGVEVITEPQQKAGIIATNKSLKEFHVNLKGIALQEVNSGNVGRVIKYPKNND